MGGGKFGAGKLGWVGIGGDVRGGGRESMLGRAGWRAITSALSSGDASSLGAWPLIVRMVQVHVGATSPPSMQVGSAASALMVSEVL